MFLDHVFWSGVYFLRFICAAKHVAEKRCSLAQQKHSHNIDSPPHTLQKKLYVYVHANLNHLLS